MNACPECGHEPPHDLERQVERYRAALVEDQVPAVSSLITDPDNLYPTQDDMARAILADRRRVAEGGKG